MSVNQVEADILHVVEHEKFIPAFIKLINKYLDSGRHHFFFIHKGWSYKVQDGELVTLDAELKFTSLCNVWKFILAINGAKKIVLHGLFSSRLILLLFLQPWVLKKCYWIIWGGDLYTYAMDRRNWRWWIKEFFRRPIIRRFGQLVTYVDGDVSLARKWYQANGLYHQCIVYPSNVYHPVELPTMPHQGLNILVGNSADSSNEHLDVFRYLTSEKIRLNKVFVPLSYGEFEYAQIVIDQGQSMLGQNFVPLRDFMPYSNYLKMLAGIDIAIFNHRRQQGMGNIIALLGMGKTVCIRSDTTSWQTLKGMGLHLRDTINLELSTFSPEELMHNRAIVQERFSENVLVRQLRAFLED